MRRLSIICFFLIFMSATAQDISSYWLGTWQITPVLTCQHSACCCFSSTVDITVDETGELHLSGPVQGSACNGPTKQDNIDSPRTLSFMEEFFGLDDYNFTLANSTDLSGLTITAVDESPQHGVCSFSLYRQTSQLLFGNFYTPQPAAVQPLLPFWAFPYLGTWQFDSSCVAASESCCCLLGMVNISVDLNGARSFIVSSSSTSQGCRLSGGAELDDFPWPSSGSATNSTVDALGFLVNQDEYTIKLSFNQALNTYSLVFADTTTPQCSMQATRMAVSLPPILIGRSTSRIGTYVTEATATDLAFAFWVNWTNSLRGGIRVGSTDYRPVKMVEYNDASDHTLIPLIYQHLTTIDKVSALFSPYSSTLTAAAESYTAGLPFLFVGSTTDSLYGKIPNAFGLSPPSMKRAASCMQAAAQKGARTVAAIYTQGDVFNSVASSEALQTCIINDMQVIANDSFVGGSLDFSMFINIWRELDPDVLVISATTPDPFNIITAIRKANWWPRQIYFTTASSLDSARMAATAAGEEWMVEYVTAPDSWRPDQVGTDPYFGSPTGFALAFQDATNETAVSTYVSAFAAGYALTLAIEAAGSLEADDIAAALHMLDATFWYGTLSFGSNGAANGGYMCIQILDGLGSTIAPQDMAVTPYVFPAIKNAPAEFYNKHSHKESHDRWIWLGILIGIMIVAVIAAIAVVSVRIRSWVAARGRLQKEDIHSEDMWTR